MTTFEASIFFEAAGAVVKIGSNMKPPLPGLTKLSLSKSLTHSVEQRFPTFLVAWFKKILANHKLQYSSKKGCQVKYLAEPLKFSGNIRATRQPGWEPLLMKVKHNWGSQINIEIEIDMDIWTA